MAAGGWKIFTPGDVLTADDTMDYLQQGVLVFDSSGARGSAIASPVEGQFSYLKDTDSTEYYDGAAWTQVAQGGLVHIVTESFSAVSSVSLDNCFSGDYDNYLVIANITSTSTSAHARIRLRASGSDETSANYSFGATYNGFNNTPSAEGAANQTSMNLTYMSDAANAHALYMPITGPNDAGFTYVSQNMSADNGASSYQGLLKTTTVYDGFSLYPSSGSFTGTVSVYGYKK